MTECAQIRDRLIALEELDAGERRLVEAHLAACPGCAQEAVQIRQILEQVRALPVPEPPAAFWEEFGATVRRRVAGAPAPRPSTWAWVASGFGRLADPWRVSAVAAATALALVAVFGLVKSHRPQRDIPPVEVLAVGEDLAIGQNLEVLEDLDLFEELDVLERLDLLRQPNGSGRPRLG